MAYKTSSKGRGYYRKPAANSEPTERKPLPPPSAAQQNVLNFVQQSEENMCVLARAGSGKTTTIEMLVRKVREVTPNVGILVCAFQRDIKTVIAGRLADLGTDKVQVQTSYSIGYKALAPFKCGKAKEEKVPNIVRGIIGPDDAEMVTKLTQCVQMCKVTLLDTEQGIDEVIDTYGIDSGKGSARKQFTQIVLEVLKRDRDMLKQAKIIDYQDMLYLPVVFDLEVPQFDHVTVDEGQDLSPAQFALIMKSMRKGGRMSAVGDDRQALFGWNGADARALQRIIEQTNAHVLPLSVTYRCAKNIVRFLNDIVPDLEAAPNAPEGILAPMTNEDMLANVRAGDFILARTNAPLMRICTRLNAMGRPANILGRDVSWQYTQAITKSGAQSVDGFRDWNRAWCAEKRGELLLENRKTEWVDDKEACIEALCEGARTLDDVRVRIRTMFQDGNHTDRVMLSTAHRAKGDERNRVFMLAKSFKKDKEEEANVFYVAGSRAKEALYLVQ